MVPITYPNVSVEISRTALKNPGIGGPIINLKLLGAFRRGVIDQDPRQILYSFVKGK